MVDGLDSLLASWMPIGLRPASHGNHGITSRLGSWANHTQAPLIN